MSPPMPEKARARERASSCPTDGASISFNGSTATSQKRQRPRHKKLEKTQVLFYSHKLELAAQAAGGRDEIARLVSSFSPESKSGPILPISE